MYRLNLFAGNELAACLVPIYRGQSLTGSQFGNATDTNNGPFVSGDYSETGSGGGLKGNGTSKYLNTGLDSAAVVAAGGAHVSYSGTSLETSGNVIAIGTFNGSGGAIIGDVYASYTGVNGRPVRIGPTNSGNFPVVPSPQTSESHYLGVRSSLSSLSLYQGGTLFGTNSGTQVVNFANLPVFVFALNNAGVVGAFTAARLRMYSIGANLTAAQALAFSNAVVAFNTALGRA